MVKKLHLTYWTINLPARITTVSAALTVVLLISTIVGHGKLMYPCQQISEIGLTLVMAAIVRMESSRLTFYYGFWDSRPKYERVLIACEALGVISALVSAALMMTDGMNVRLIGMLESGEVLFSYGLPFSCPLAAIVVPVNLLIAFGCFLWMSLAEVADRRNFFKSEIKGRRGATLTFKQYVQIAARCAVK